MTGQSAVDRYLEARGERDRMRENVKETADLLDRISTELRKRPITLPVERIGDWGRVRTQRNVLTKQDWPDFDRIKRLIEAAQKADENEMQAWQQVPPEHQRVMRRD